MATFPVTGPPSVDLGNFDAAGGIGSTGPSNVQADLDARPTSASLADEGGAGLVGYRGQPSYGSATTVKNRLDRMGAFLPEGAYPSSTDLDRFQNSLYYLGASTDRRTDPDGFPNWGFGHLTIPKGEWQAADGFSYPTALLGLNIVGHNSHSSVLYSDSSSARGIDLNTYSGVKIADLMLRNKHNGGTPLATDTSAGLYLRSTGGGELLQISGAVIAGFQTCIKQAPENVGDGDKTLVSGCSLVGTHHVYDQGVNRQAIGWTFLNNNIGGEGGLFKLGGAGQTCLINNIGNVYTDFLTFPEGTGNGNAFPSAGHYIGQQVTVFSQKMEFHDTDVRIIDASSCLRKTADHSPETPAAAFDVRFRDVSITGSVPNNPDELTNDIIEVGNFVEGADNIRVHMEGGSIPGCIKAGSNKTYLHGHETPHWSFSRMMVAPRPELLKLLGEGQHFLTEWRGNENVKLDQYRGGQAGNVSIDARKSFLVPTQGKYLIDTRSDGHDLQFGGRIGKRFVVPIPNTGRNAAAMGGLNSTSVLPQLGLSVFMENPTGTENATAVRVRQFTDGSFSVPLGDPVDVPARHYGLYFIHQFTTQPYNVRVGEIYVEITKANVGEWSEGVLLLDYHPYLGA